MTTATTIPQIVKDCRGHMDKAIESSKREFSSIRSGKASPSMLDTVRVEMYGTQMTLNQVASVSTPEPRVIIVTPFDKGQIKLVEKAIRESDLGLEPSAQGAIIRVPLPMMTVLEMSEPARARTVTSRPDAIPQVCRCRWWRAAASRS